MKKIVFLALAFLFIATGIRAQSEGRISGTVRSKEAVTATVSLLTARDSVVVKLSATGADGRFAFEGLATGRYMILVTAIGHGKTYSAVQEVGPGNENVQVQTINLVPVNKELAGVTVTAKRPLIEQRIDRTIVNVEASILNIGTSALEVLEKSPGVTVDRDGAISLKGKEGVLVMVDGRPTQLSGADLANMLRNMSSSQLDQIEIMTNPPARYDAAGTSGVINIKTKKTMTAGYNGSATLGVAQGRYPKTNESFSMNFRRNKVNLFGTLSHSYRKTFGLTTFQRTIFEANTTSPEHYFDQEADRSVEANSFNAKVGLDFFATKKTTVGFVLTGSTSPAESGNESVTNISNSAKNLQGKTVATVDNQTKWKSVGANLNFRRALGKKGSELTSDLDLLAYGSRNDQFMVNSFFDASGNSVQKADTLRGNLPQQINVYSGRLDYFHPLPKGARFEAGIKSGLVQTDNDAGYDSIQYGQIVHDAARSNHFLYDEWINAAYVNLSGPLSKKWSAQIGLRLENTNVTGTQLTTDETFRRQYTQLFPTAYFQYKASDRHSFGVNFGRRVRRPNYGSLNPFIRFIDRYMYSRGNPDLKPSFSNNIELSHSWRNQVTTTVNYTATADIIDEVVEQKGQETYSGLANIASLRQFGIAVSANTPLAVWWTSSMNVNVFHNRYKGVASGAPVNVAATSIIITGAQQFKLNKTLAAEISGRIRNGWLEGVMRAKPIAFMSVGFSQQAWAGKGSFRLTVRDIFHSQRFRGESRYGNVDFRVVDINESRVVSLAFTYRFSKGKKIAPTKRTAGSANEEQERIGQ
jgi:iron complex outermembrane receptor protein